MSQRNSAGRALVPLLLILMWSTAQAQVAPDAIGSSGGFQENPLRAEGTVIGPAGPAEGVQVLLEITDRRIRRQIAYLQTRTDTEGRFRFDLSEYEMPVYGLQFNTVSPRYIESLEIVVVDRTELPLEVEITVEPGTIARGTVHDPEGSPLEGVTVGGTGIRPQKSGESGEWEVFGIPPGLMTLEFFLEGYAPAFLPVQSESPQILTGFDVEMESARRLKGEVVNWAGETVANPVLYLQLADQYQQVAGDSDGQFEFMAVPEELAGGQIQVFARGYLPRTVDIQPDRPLSEKLAIVVDHGVWIRGRAFLPSGDPAAGATVSAGEDYSVSMPRVSCDAEGQWLLGPFFPGSEEIVTITPPNPEESWAVADVVLRSVGSPGTYQGEVELWPKGFSSDFEGRFANGKIVLDRRDDGKGGFGGVVHYEGAWDGEAEIIEGTVDVVGMRQEGTFEMRRRFYAGEGLAGEWELSEKIGASRLRVAPVQERVRLAVITGEMGLDLELAEAMTLKGQVVDASGDPLLDGTVMVREWNNTTVYPVTAEIGVGGRFEFTRLPDGVLLLQAASREGDQITPVMPARAGTEGVVLRMDGDWNDPIAE